MEDYILMEQVEKYGKQWSKIAKKFQEKRTDHMVKNHYLSLIQKWKKEKKSKLSPRQIHIQLL